MTKKAKKAEVADSCITLTVIVCYDGYMLLFDGLRRSDLFSKWVRIKRKGAGSKDFLMSITFPVSCESLLNDSLRNGPLSFLHESATIKGGHHE